jgi:hypothetical protein
MRTTHILASFVHVCYDVAMASVTHETLALNMCSIYELAAAAPATAKRTLHTWVRHVTPGDLDPACIRL